MFKYLIVLLILTGCASSRHVSIWPYRGSFISIVSYDDQPGYVEVRDGMGRALLPGVVRRGKPLCFRWPFIHAVGEISVRGAKTYQTTFEPWSHEAWRWDLGVDSASEIPNQIIASTKKWCDTK